MVKRSRLEQPRLFDVLMIPVGLTGLQHSKALVLLGTLLTEALAGGIDSAVIQSQEAGDDEDHG